MEVDNPCSSQAQRLIENSSALGSNPLHVIDSFPSLFGKCLVDTGRIGKAPMMSARMLDQTGKSLQG